MTSVGLLSPIRNRHEPIDKRVVPKEGKHHLYRSGFLDRWCYATILSGYCYVGYTDPGTTLAGAYQQAQRDMSAYNKLLDVSHA